MNCPDCEACDTEELLSLPYDSLHHLSARALAAIREDHQRGTRATEPETT